MYAWIWRHLPGPTPIRILLSVVLVALVIVVLFGWVFPWLEPRLPFAENFETTAGHPAAVDLSLGSQS